jgi:polyhydroxyalkanoate synthesis regulator phasin
MMKDILMDTFKLGLGAMDMTREQAAKLVNKIEKKYPGEIKDGRKMIGDLVSQAEKNAKAFEKLVAAEVQKAVKQQKLVEEKDLKELASNVKELAKTTAKIGKQVGKKGAAAAKKGVKKAKAAAKKRKPKKATKRKPAKRKVTKRKVKKKASKRTR